MDWKEGVFATLLAAVLTFLVTGVAQAQLFTSTAALDRKNLGELKQAMEQASIENKHKAKLKAMGDKAGRAFWNDCFAEKILETALLPKIVSLGSSCGDRPSDGSWIDLAHGSLLQSECSYTSPKGGEFTTMLNLRGSKKVVLFCLDSRNWGNYGAKGVLCALSEGEVEFITAETAEQQWKLPAADWKEPATKIFGVAKPFQRTYQEADCAAYIKSRCNPQRPHRLSRAVSKEGALLDNQGD